MLLQGGKAPLLYWFWRMYFYRILEALRYLQLVSWQILRLFRLNGIHFPLLNLLKLNLGCLPVSSQIYLIPSKAKSGFMQIKLQQLKRKNIFKPSLEH
jgi:hypothetical protein